MVTHDPSSTDLQEIRTRARTGNSSIANGVLRRREVEFVVIGDFPLRWWRSFNDLTREYQLAETYKCRVYAIFAK